MSSWLKQKGYGRNVWGSKFLTSFGVFNYSEHLGENSICLVSDWFLKISNLTYQVHMTLWSQQTFGELPAKSGYTDVSEVPGTHVLMCTTSLITWSPDHAMLTVPKACNFTSWNFFFFFFVLLYIYLIKRISP